MSLKFQIEKLEDVAENLRSLYTPHEGKFFLDVDGAVSREKLDEFRTNNITRFEGPGPDRIQASQSA